MATAKNNAAKKKAAPKKPASKKASPDSTAKTGPAPLEIEAFAENIETAGHQNLIHIKSPEKVTSDPTKPKIVAQIYIPATHEQGGYFGSKKQYAVTFTEITPQEASQPAGEKKEKNFDSKPAAKKGATQATKSASSKRAVAKAGRKK